MEDGSGREVCIFLPVYFQVSELAQNWNDVFLTKQASKTHTQTLVNLVKFNNDLKGGQVERRRVSIAAK